MNVLILTGAGVSAESGVPTFRGPDGLWEGERVEDVATPEGFVRDPERVHQFYNARRRAVQQPAVAPNAAHAALAELERAVMDAGGSFLLVTQNIDGLHARAGSENVLAMHGELLQARCVATGRTLPWTGDLTCDTPSPFADPSPDEVEAQSGYRSHLRPHVVWFGEMPIGLERIEAAARRADVFAAIGTSGRVYPAAGVVHATPAGCRTVEINLEDTEASPGFGERVRGRAGAVVPEWCAALRAAVMK